MHWPSQVTSRKDQEQYWAKKDKHYRFFTATEFAEAFQSFHIGQKIGDELATPFDKSKAHPAALTTKKYGVSKKELFKACVSREWLLMKRNSFVYIFKMTQVRCTQKHHNLIQMNQYIYVESNYCLHVFFS